MAGRSGMQVLALAVAAFAVVALLAGWLGEAGALPLYVPLSGFALAGVVYAARGISAFVRVFVAMYAVGYLFLAAASLLAGLRTPAANARGDAAARLLRHRRRRLRRPRLRRLLPPRDPHDHAPSPIPTSSRTEPATRATGPFHWLGRTEGRIGRMLVALSIFITFAQVALQIRPQPLVPRPLQRPRAARTPTLSGTSCSPIFVPLAAVWIAIAIYDIFVDYSLRIRWRAWLTENMYDALARPGHPLPHPLHRRAGRQPGPAHPGRTSTPSSRPTMSLSIRLLSQAATLVSFIDHPVGACRATSSSPARTR